MSTRAKIVNAFLLTGLLASIAAGVLLYVMGMAWVESLERCRAL